MKKRFQLFMCLCLAVGILSGCGRAKPTAADSVKAIYDLYILGDTEGVSELGLTDENIADAQAAYDLALAATIRSNFSASGLEISEESLAAICQARKEALASMTAQFTLVSETGDQAQVLLSTTYFDELELDADAAYAARDEADQAGLTDYDEYMEFVMTCYTDHLIEGYQNVVPSEEIVSLTIDCTIVNNVWMPVDMSSFGSDLSQAVSGQIPQ